MVDESNTWMSPDLQEERRMRVDVHEVMPPQKKLIISSCTPAAIFHGDNDDVELPLPVNGREYRKPEIVNILASYKKSSKEIGMAMKKMIQLKYGPVCDCSLKQLIERANNSETVLDKDWQYGRGGLPPVASLNEIKAIAENMEDQSGCIISQDHISKLLHDHLLKKIEDAGYLSMDSS